MIDNRCVGCGKIVEGNQYTAFFRCSTYTNPELFPWRVMDCMLATHILRVSAVTQKKERVGQQKQRKAK